MVSKAPEEKRLRGEGLQPLIGGATGGRCPPHLEPTRTHWRGSLSRMPAPHPHPAFPVLFLHTLCFP